MQTKTPSIPQHCFPTDVSISPKNFSFYKKNFPKYINYLQITKPSDKPFGLSYLRYVKRAKQVDELALFQPFNPSQRSKCRESLALIKSLRKSLKSLSGVPSFHEKYCKHLSALAHMDLRMTEPEPYKALSFYQHLKHFTFHIDTSHHQEILLLEKQLKKNKRRLERYFGRLRSLKSVEIRTGTEDLGPFLKVMKLLEASSKLIPSLKGFILKLRCGLVYSFPHEIPLTDLDSFSSLPFVTSLSIERLYTMMPMFEIGKMQNLRKLNLDIHSLCVTDRGPNNLDYLSNLKDLKRLRSLSLGIQSNLKEVERMLFEVLTLPVSLESIELKIRGFIWKDCEITKKNNKEMINSIREHERYKKFYDQWKNLKELKYLCLRVLDQKSRSGEIAGAFAAMIFQQTQRLESVDFHYSNSRSDEDETNMGALDLKILIEALEKSKKTLKRLGISGRNINFVEDISFEFMMIESFTVHGEILASPNTAKYLKSLLMKEQRMTLILKELVVNNIKTFEALLETVKNLTKNVVFHLHLDLLDLEKKAWWEIFCTEVERLRSKGKVSLGLENVFIKDMEALRRMKTAVLGSALFERFLLKSKFMKNKRSGITGRNLVYLSVLRNVIQEDINPDYISEYHEIINN